ncbi:hypothetical protein BRAS3843_2180001 [Bradyrhizobium sp. STM 3843]|nr:hypothetical protein BRAS3843_2180001 [Bradyrhizobium sp. STM 3843]
MSCAPPNAMEHDPQSPSRGRAVTRVKGRDAARENAVALSIFDCMAFRKAARHSSGSRSSQEGYL